MIVPYFLICKFRNQYGKHIRELTENAEGSPLGSFLQICFLEDYVCALAAYQVDEKQLCLASDKIRLPSSRVTRFMFDLAAATAMPRPTAVLPVNAICGKFEHTHHQFVGC